VLRPLAFVASRVRVEEKLLLAELDRRGIGYQIVDPRTAVFTVDGRDLPYRSALLREISHYRALYGAKILEHSGVRVINSAEAVARCGDKLETTLALQRAGLPVPRCALALTPEAAAATLAEFGYPAVVKPLTGSWGRMVSRLNDQDAATAVLEHRAALQNPLHRITYIQEYVDKPARDIRGLVAGDEVVGAVYRVSEDWRTNTARVADTRPCPVTDELAEILIATAKAIGDGFYGIDLLEDRDGAIYVNEVNHTPEFHGAAQALSTDIAACYIDHVLRRLGGAP
jgi:[lysine-biosynthesis-protein LysW]---L-2-aminoadipate ligase